jgi:hypothetical protein
MMAAQGWRKRQIEGVIIKSNINQLLQPMLGRSELVDAWWDSKNKAFDMKTPEEVYQTGAEGRLSVYQYVLGSSDGYW